MIGKKMSSGIKFENVGFRYGTGPEIIEDASFDIKQGSFHFLTGTSGAGKSTLLKLMYMSLKPNHGLIKVFDKDILKISRKKIPFIRRKVGVVFQDYQLLSHMSVFDNVALPLRIIGMEEDQVKQHVSELLNWVGLSNFLYSHPDTLSGGQKQRVAIARAVINKPSIIIADEPTGNVDESMAIRLLYLFEEMNKLGTTIIIATHNEAIVSKFHHNNLRIEHGRVRSY